MLGATFLLFINNATISISVLVFINHLSKFTSLGQIPVSRITGANVFELKLVKDKMLL